MRLQLGIHRRFVTLSHRGYEFRRDGSRPSALKEARPLLIEKSGYLLCAASALEIRALNATAGGR